MAARSLEAEVLTQTGMQHVKIGYGKTPEAAYKDAVGQLPNRTLEDEAIIRHQIVEGSVGSKKVSAIAYDLKPTEKKGSGATADVFMRGRAERYGE